MKRMAMLIFVGTLLMVGCGTQSDQTATAGPKPNQTQFLNLQQAQNQLPFEIRLPHELPHGMVFNHAMLEINPNNNKANGVILNFSSPDQTWVMEVQEREGSHFMKAESSKVKELTINGKEAEYSTDGKTSQLSWTDGHLVYNTSASAKADYGTEQGMVDLAKNFE